MLGRFNLSLRASTSAISGDLESGRTPQSGSVKRLRFRRESISESSTPFLINSTTTGYRVGCGHRYRNPSFKTRQTV